MDIHSHLRIASFLAKQLDARFRLLGVRFGLAPILGAVPVIGDVVDVLLSLYIVWIGIQLRMPDEKIGKMITNIAINFVIGLIPLIGEATYIFRKVNLKNMQLIDDYVKAHPVIEGQLAR